MPSRDSGEPAEGSTASLAAGFFFYFFFLSPPISEFRYRDMSSRVIVNMPCQQCHLFCFVVGFRLD